MNLTSYISVICFAVSAIIGYFVRNIMGRLDNLEEQMYHTVSEEKTRQLIADKTDSIKEDIREIKNTINKLLDLYIQDKGTK